MCIISHIIIDSEYNHMRCSERREVYLFYPDLLMVLFLYYGIIFK